jgi:CRP-like cAMP-binding protein
MSMKDLSDIAVFSGLGEKDLRDIEPLFVQETFKKKELIFSEGDSPRWFYFVLKGEVKITKLSQDGKEIILELIQPGGFFGGVAVIRGFPYPANAVVKEDADVLKISRENFQKVLDRFPAVMMDIMQNIGDRIKESRETTKNIALEKVHLRIAALLLKLSEQSGVEDKDGIVLNLKLTKQDIAEMVGTTVETAIRTMSAFKKQGLIGEKAGKILIKDPAGLHDLGL